MKKFVLIALSVALFSLVGCGFDSQSSVVTDSDELTASTQSASSSRRRACGGILGNVYCKSNEYCKTRTCGGMGICAKVPTACTMEYVPVCGCDGNTYSNKCMAAANAQNIASRGSCEGDDTVKIELP